MISTSNKHDLKSFRFVVFPLWFGGYDEGTKEAEEAAYRQANACGRMVADMEIDRSNLFKWLVTVKLGAVVIRD